MAMICVLLDIHAVLDHLYLAGTQPEITTPAERGWVLKWSCSKESPLLTHDQLLRHHRTAEEGTTCA